MKDISLKCLLSPKEVMYTVTETEIKPGNAYHIILTFGVSLVAQMAKNLPTV